ncbi:MAG: hypothetical protein HC844_21100 [Tabrizicola sp.]|nr:hypothetical protein [Tabrizicola sp.]
MTGLVAQGIVPEGCTVSPAPALAPPKPGLCAEGALIAFAFGQMRAETLGDLARLGLTLRLTPWRMILLAGAASLPDLPGLVIRADDPLLRVTACAGAPDCMQALGATRQLARSLAALVPEDRHLHVSGCSKGCAHPAAADLTLVATAAGYDLVRAGSASDAAALTGLRPPQIARHLKDTDAASL